jgi:hypothetical protein
MALPARARPGRNPAAEVRAFARARRAGPQWPLSRWRPRARATRGALAPADSRSVPWQTEAQPWQQRFSAEPLACARQAVAPGAVGASSAVHGVAGWRAEPRAHAVCVRARGALSFQAGARWRAPWTRAARYPLRARSSARSSSRRSEPVQHWLVQETSSQSVRARPPARPVCLDPAWAALRRALRPRPGLLGLPTAGSVARGAAPASPSRASAEWGRAPSAIERIRGFVPHFPITGVIQGTSAGGVLRLSWASQSSSLRRR